MEDLPGWGIISIPEPPPRQHEHERRYTPVTHPFILTRRTWKDDYNGQMIFGEPFGPKASWYLFYRWGKTPKKPRPGNLFRPRIEPGPAAWQARMLPPAPQLWTSCILIICLNYFLCSLCNISLHLVVSIHFIGGEGWLGFPDLWSGKKTMIGTDI